MVVFFGCMVKVGPPIFYLFDHLVKNLAVQFCNYLALWLRPYGQVRFSIALISRNLKSDFLGGTIFGMAAMP